MWPFRHRDTAPLEQRAQGGAGFTDAVTRALLEAAAGATVRDPSATAALEAAAGAYARAFAVATVRPATSTTRALRPDVLALLGRDLIRRGEAVHVIEVGRDGAVTLLPAGSWDVTGGPDPSTWRYRCDTFGPSGNTTRMLPAAQVVHARYSIDPARPWFGIGPLGWATLTGRLHAALEDALADEAGGTRGHVLPMPQGPAVDGDDPATDDPQAQLRADIAALHGQTVMVETTAAGYGEGRGAAPLADWKPQRLGAAPPAPLATLRTDSAMAVLGACGVPPTLLVGGDAAAKRESWRQFLHGSVQPLAEILAAELAAKLDAPGLQLGFDRLFASDLQGRARAYQSMTGAGMDRSRAATLAGLAE